MSESYSGCTRSLLNICIIIRRIDDAEVQIEKERINDREVYKMRFIGNILWFIFGGFWMGLGWLAAGCLWCITVIGIPIGVQCFKFAGLAFFPFGKEVSYGGGIGSFLCNILWLLFSGIPLAVEAVVLGCGFCITIIGIPFGLQCFKLAKLALMPFGARVD